ncbi:DUF5723 family protein [Abyssalbus ytuae]|uniref:DUF5723 family protein n=1 Tax=Abyssalbus ytuae TaxID=2926907 RepID=A0A9E6ZPH7_9FLAO|nr:DUF5723 family protein [Abyssalbus ytuae]UOB16368.1 DUF5723 family protein [Abyssalbus ytuae]
MQNEKLSILFLFLGLISCFSQNKQILYNFSEIPQSLLLNPATEVKSKLFIGVPLLSGVHAHGGLSGFTVADLFADDGVDFNEKLRSLIYSTASNDVVASNVQVDILSGGFKAKNPFKRIFYSFGIYQEADFYMNWPRDLAILAYDGNVTDKLYALSDLVLEAEVLTVYHFGFTEEISNKLTVGARAKIYSSAYNINSTRNQGTFLTTEGTNNIYSHKINATLSLQSSGFPLVGRIDDDDLEYDPLKQIKKSIFLGGNLGVGFDVGFTYHSSDRLTYTGSILDVGIITQSKEIQNFNFEGFYTFEGFEFLFPELVTDGELNDYWEDLKNELEDMYSEDNKSYLTWRPIKINGGMEYSFGKKKSEVCDCLLDEDTYMNLMGAHLYTVLRPKAPQMALTAFYSRKISDFLTTKVTYTIDKYSFNNIGLGVSFNYANFNFYMLADNLLEYQNLSGANSLTVQFGFNFMMQ